MLVVLVASFSFLGRWQWTRAMSSTGGAQNLIYALQWWTFALVVIYGWWRMVRDELHPVTPAAILPMYDESLPPSLQRHKPLPPTRPEEDDELAAYNDYLAWLNANPRN